MDVIVFETTQLGDRSYLVHDASVALVVDPQRDTDRVEAAAREAGVTITHVAETHIHNDYLSGGLELARAHGASYLVNAADQVKFARQPITDGQTVRVGALTVKAVATPGHTHTHLSFIVDDGGQQAVFSGGSLLYGSVGRTDLVGAGDTLGLTHEQYASVRRLVREAAPGAGLFPTHGFGSFCSSGPASRAGSSTIGDELTSNHALMDPDEDHFVQELIANLTAYPSYYAHMGVTNAAGPGPADLAVPESLDPGELTRRLKEGEWVVDLRRRVAFASNHLLGSVSFEYGTSFSTYLGWILPWGEQLTLVGSRDDVDNAIRDLSRIGIEAPAAALGTDPHALAPRAALASYPRVGWDGMLAGRGPGDTVVDVRRADEYAVARVAGAVNVPLHELLRRLDSIAEGKLWVHCTSGYRAGIAASLLQRAGRDVVHVDAKFADAGPAGIPVDSARLGTAAPA
ncbi:glyoxylase-like metal-dependent hydrolase (beta-lactamase superfamily II)/rhodanese-related sulfurtransferase [Arthrobacter ginsengisoli]|uniref:Glyoxylase-like metal-dependent hydrolase (Beta-lactamase superfamily II)/rhodanese-related sulfurtransferase n=1 Tax=Arthrobacter ginsengisoli TaxID=1356565 RepID=A0ABU1U926_9MICC|nr:MBL fold metallo-hydrolase [Arthrobacter ginsengisoli]MDR7081645.1 glyoxylase-like metal-dependent hydrolase (beta-lactamase superfamily II)/rhodanese-related sulfurtransferase [Arthrobacter ginsengisoli]